MHARWWFLVASSAVAVGACADARPEPARPAAPSGAAPPEARADSEATHPANAPTVSATAPPVEPPADDTDASAGAASAGGSLPLICEAYFARFRHCMEAPVRKHPDASTRAAVLEKLAEAEQRSRASMAAGMEPADADAYCRQALLALTASTCE